ncbi:protein NDUFAF4 homolog isoform X2 [Malaya genurostris]|uniref:protein NDUFAF4 homolog isoform X2 n=1 Tax=Malaya genurostris TaxID=325434 RepID=UPI0026F3C695|nr:protein NDUFAF4 homolog isoform X2 [Malaya genurostris]
MGKILSIVSRQVKLYNVENRAQKVISQAKPQSAPMFESNLKDLDRVLSEHPDLIQKLNTKNKELDENLKVIFVTSTDSHKSMHTKDSTKSLPSDRAIADDFEFGHLEPLKISRGHCTLRQAIKFISDHHSSQSEWTVSKIAKEYSIREPVIQNILSYFKTFELHMPDKNAEKRNILLKFPNKTRSIE